MNLNSMSTTFAKSEHPSVFTGDETSLLPNKKNLLLRFSCSLVGNGKKVSGHKILLQSLFLLRQNYGRSIFLEENSDKSKIFEKNIRQFKIYPLFLFSYTKQRKSFFSLLSSCFLPTDSTRLNVSKTAKATSFSLSLSMTMTATTTKDCFSTKSRDQKRFSKKKYHLFTASNKGSIDRPDHELFASESPLSKSLCMDCVQSVQPILETRKVRKGRVTYKVPKVTSIQRQKGKAIAILKQNAASRKKGDLKNLKTYYSGSLFPELKTNPFLSTLFSEKAKSKSIETPAENLQKNEISFLSLTPLGASPKHPSSFFRRQDVAMEKEVRKKDVNSIASSQENLLFSNNIFLTTLEKKHFLYSLRKPILKDCLSEEFFESGNEKGESIEKKKQLHLLALQNRAYLHFRWW